MRSAAPPSDARRTMLLIITIALLVIWAVMKWQLGSEGPARFVAAACGRVGLVMGAIWLAWPSLRRPARWLPPGIAVAGVVVLAVLAAQPRLIIVVLPAFGALLTFAAFARGFRGK